jgi:hypothetical protein
MATLDSIADEIGFTRNELMQSMVKFGLTNRDWRNEGLTAHKRLPRYQENPGMATKPPSAAQLAARARFAEMARNGSLNRKRQIAAKQSAGVKRKANPASDIKWERYLYGPSKGEIATVDGAQVLIFPIKKSETDEYDMPEWARAVVEIFPSATHDEAHYPVGSVQNGKDNVHRLVAQAKIKRNPAKKTVSQKISQLVHEGYPQKQAVAVALNEQRAGKVKRNPAKDRRGSPKVRTGYIVEDGEVKTVPIMESFRYQIGLKPHNFFVRSHGGYNMVFEKSTGLAVGKIPYRLTLQGSMTDAAKSYLAAVVKKVGARELNSAIAKAPTVEDRIENDLLYAELTE